MFSRSILQRYDTTTTKVTDLDYKTKYKASVAVFSVFFVIILIATSFLIYLFCKKRKVLAAQAKEAASLEESLTKKKLELENHQKLLEQNE